MAKKKSSRGIAFIAIILVVILAIVTAIVLFTRVGNASKTDEEIVREYLQNKEAEYTDEQKVEIINAYKNMLETKGKDYVDSELSQEDQTDITFLGMSVQVYVFRDFKKYAYLNAEESFIDVGGYQKIAGFDVNATTGADGYADISAVDIVIDDNKYATADFTEEMAYFFERFEQANAAETTNTIYGTDEVVIDDNTKIYITYLDVQYDDSRNITALRVSGHLLMK